MKKIALSWLLALCCPGCNLAPAGSGQRNVERPLNDIDWNQTPFVFEGCKMYYRGKAFEIGWPLKDYEKVFGKAYRRVDSMGSYGHDNVFTFDGIGVMLLGKRYGTAAQKDSILQINIVFNYTFEELDYFAQKDGLTDKMQLPNNYARPKQFYSQQVRVNGVALQFGPQGLSVRQANQKLEHANAAFDPSGMPSSRSYHVYCNQPQNDSTTVYTLNLDENPDKVQQLEISKSNSIF